MDIEVSFGDENVELDYGEEAHEASISTQTRTTTSTTSTTTGTSPASIAEVDLQSSVGSELAALLDAQSSIQSQALSPRQDQKVPSRAPNGLVTAFDPALLIPSIPFASLRAEHRSNLEMAQRQLNLLVSHLHSQAESSSATSVQPLIPFRDFLFEIRNLSIAVPDESRSRSLRLWSDLSPRDAKTTVEWARWRLVATSREYNTVRSARLDRHTRSRSSDDRGGHQAFIGANGAKSAQKDALVSLMTMADKATVGNEVGLARKLLMTSVKMLLAVVWTELTSLADMADEELLKKDLEKLTSITRFRPIPRNHINACPPLTKHHYDPVLPTLTRAGQFLDRHRTYTAAALIRSCQWRVFCKELLGEEPDLERWVGDEELWR